MPTFEAGQVVRVPFPYTDRSTRQRRPALVVSRGPVGRNDAFLWVAMITSASNAGWPGDIPIRESASMTGLPAPSLVRPTKIATIDSALADQIGRVSEATRIAVSDMIRASLA